MTHTTDPPPGWDAGANLAELGHATASLLASVAELPADDTADILAPSLLPGWTRGHVLSHIARNADGLVNLATWARTGQEVAMYAAGTRDAQIEAGARRTAGEHAADIEASAQRLHDALGGLTGEALRRRVRFASGRETAGWELAGARLQEVEIHHVDLDMGYTPAHWSPEWCVATLEHVVPTFRDARETPIGTLIGTGGGSWKVGTAATSLTGPESGLLAWLLGRSDGDGLHYDGDGPIPRAPVWL